MPLNSLPRDRPEESRKVFENSFAGFFAVLGFTKCIYFFPSKRFIFEKKISDEIDSFEKYTLARKKLRANLRVPIYYCEFDGIFQF